MIIERLLVRVSKHRRYDTTSIACVDDFCRSDEQVPTYRYIKVYDFKHQQSLSKQFRPTCQTDKYELPLRCLESRYYILWFVS